MRNSVKTQLSIVARSKNYQAQSKKNKSRVRGAIRSGRVLLTNSTNNTEAVAGLHYTLKHYGKMTDLVSISTSVLENPICQARRLDPDSICYHCFAAAQMGCYKQMQPIFGHNLEVLKDHLLEPNEIPVILSKSGLGRGESFGDACSIIQAANYMRIAEANPWLDWAVWTKNPIFYHRALELELCTKPDNLNIVLSSRKVNSVDEVPEKFRYFIDKVFTVYDEDGIKEQGVTINCGARSCAKCRRCYKKNKPGVDVEYVYEHLK